MVAGGSLAGRRVVATSIQGGDGSAPVAGPFPSPLATPILAGMVGRFTSRVFIGRAEELRRLAVTLDRAEQEQPQLVLLAGDAGWARLGCWSNLPTGPSSAGRGCWLAGVWSLAMLR